MNKYKPNLHLEILLILGFGIYGMRYILPLYYEIYDIDLPISLFSFSIIMQTPGIIISILSAILVTKDAKRINAGKAFPKERFFQSKTWKPISWGILVLFIWFIMLPLYLVKRKKIFYINYQKKSNRYKNKIYIYESDEMLECPYCRKKLDFPEIPIYCPYCEQELREKFLDEY